MHEFESHFQLLELEPDASLDEVQRAYRDLVMIWHPDRFAHNVRLQRKAEEKVKQFNDAYLALKQWYGSRSGRSVANESRQSHPKQEHSHQHSSQSSAVQDREHDSSFHSTSAEFSISFADAEYILHRYRFELLSSVHSEQTEYQSEPFCLWVSDHPLEVTLAVPCHKLHAFDRILLLIPCKSTGHFYQEEAERLLQLLQVY
ncbi:MAG TPA: J domain-containing protein [Stenomitos sp.]